MELGEDWRIQSGLLAQQIISEKNLGDFCIFNEFMIAFLKGKIGNECQILKQPDEQVQEEFLKYFQSEFGNDEASLRIFSNNLTFKTLSLGFYITASDIWMRTFKKYSKQSINCLNCIEQDSHKSKPCYFATFNKNTGCWIIESNDKIQSQIKPFYDKLSQRSEYSDFKKEQNFFKISKLGSSIVNIQEIKTQSSNSSQNAIYHVISLSNQFYLFLFSVWIIFNIRKSFNSNCFSSSVYQRYCDAIINQKRKKIEKSEFSNKNLRTNLDFTDQVCKRIKDLCDIEWKNLMKDFMIALNDDKQIIKNLIKNIGKSIEKQFYLEIQSKKQTIAKQQF